MRFSYRDVTSSGNALPTRSFNFWGLLLLVSTVTACGVQPSTKELAKELQTVASWAATAHMVGDTWLRGAVPTAYAKQTLQTAQEELQTEANTLVKVAPAQDRTQALNQLHHLEQTLSQMTTAAEQQDPPSMTQRIQQLSIQEQAIHRLLQATSQQP